MKQRDFSFLSSGERIAASLLCNEDRADVSSSALALHGAGDAIRQRTFYLADTFARFGCETLYFDHSGHGESSGTLRKSSLERRRKQALDASKQVKTPIKLITGNSMGGYVATTLLKDLKPEHLILVCPALYSAEAHSLEFDNRFSEALRKPQSYLAASTLEDLAAFRGRVLLMIGSEDKVIPPPVMDVYRSAFTNASELVDVVVQGAPHRIHIWAQEEKSNEAKVLGPIRDFLNV